MHIVQIQHEKVPVLFYGGTERIIETLSLELIKLGHKVTLISYKGDYEIPGVNFIDLASLGSKDKADKDFMSLVPKDADILHFHLPRDQDNLDLKGIPYICTLHGNEDDEKKKKLLPKFLVGVSRNHAQRHGSEHYVYNGLNFNNVKIGKRLDYRQHFCFLGKASLKRKGLEGAKKVAKHFNEELHIGGKSGFKWGNFKYLGALNDEKKYELLASSKALLFPIQWEEPFGLVMIEAMACGTPVFALSRGSVPEVLGKAGGEGLFLEAGSVEALIQQMEEYDYEKDPERIREYVDNYFSGKEMTQNYLAKYDLIISKTWKA